LFCIAGAFHIFSLRAGSKSASLCDPNWLAVAHGNNRILLFLKICVVVVRAVRTCAGEKVLQVNDKPANGFNKCNVSTVIEILQLANNSIT
jgi:hypothetical protein